MVPWAIGPVQIRHSLFKDKMANARKNKITLTIWLTNAEEESLKESLEILNKESTSKENGYAMSNITEIIQEAYNRGDLIK